MAVTINPAANPANKGRDEYIGSSVDIVLDNSYPTGGYALTAPQFGLVNILTILPAIALNGSTLLHVYWNSATQKLMAFVAAGTEVTNATDLSAVTVRVQAFGR